VGLSSTDPKPTEITLEDAYERIREWYTANVPLLKERMKGRPYPKESEELMCALPASGSLTGLEIRAVLGEVIYGYLEWAYHESDGRFKMAAYAHAALEQAGLEIGLSTREKEQIRSSALWPYLIISRHEE
jgi:hypothetical protein